MRLSTQVTVLIDKTNTRAYHGTRFNIVYPYLGIQLVFLGWIFQLCQSSAYIQPFLYWIYETENESGYSSPTPTAQDLDSRLERLPYMA